MRQDPTGFQATPPLDHLVAKVLAGEATLDEVALVNQQLALPVSDRSGTLSLDQVTNSLHTLPVPPRFDAHVLWHRLQTRLATREARPLSRGERFKTQPLHRGLWPLLAGAVLTGVILLVGWQMRSDHRHAHGPMPVSTYVTGNGERATITLPDGNTVALNVASRLEVPADYLAGNHALRLSGEALFTVQHHTKISFTVLAGQTTTQVLGTRFIMRHYSTDTSTTVAVQEGKVETGATVVTANRLVEVYRNGMATLRPVSPSQFSFVTGTLVLDDLFLPAAIPELDRWYDVDIRLGDSTLAARGVGGKFGAGSLGDLAEYLKLTLDVRVVRDGRVFTLYPRR